MSPETGVWSSEQLERAQAGCYRFGIGYRRFEMSVHFSCNGHFTMTFSEPIVSDYGYFLTAKVRKEPIK